MSFTPNIPQTGQTLGQTRAAVNNNFANYFNTIAVNHIAPNNAGAGKHNLSEYVVQAQSPATAASEVATYSRSISGTPELCLQKQNQLAAAADVQMSRLDTGVLAAQNGYSFLPGGVIIQWGQYATGGDGNAINYPIPFTAAVFSVVLTPDSNSNVNSTIFIRASSLSDASKLTRFITDKVGASNFPICWIAIGN